MGTTTATLRGRGVARRAGFHRGRGARRRAPRRALRVPRRRAGVHRVCRAAGPPALSQGGTTPGPAHNLVTPRCPSRSPPSASCWRPFSSPMTVAPSAQQAEQPRINELAVLEEVLPQEPLLLEPALLQDTGRRRVV